jgi:hypothetical protein
MTEDPKPPNVRAIDQIQREREMQRWYCPGRKDDGRSCNTLLMEVALGHGGVVRIKCPKCNTWSTLENR